MRNSFTKRTPPAPARLGEDGSHLERRNRRTIHYILADDLATLVWLANLAAIELHPSLALAEDITCPTMMVFDLDPGPPANIVQCCQVGLWLREIFAHFGLQSFPKTSGSKGLQIYVPLNTANQLRIDQDFFPRAGAVARTRASRAGCFGHEEASCEGKGIRRLEPERRAQDDRGVYSLRAREHPTVSTPVSWEEVERALKKKDASLLVFEAKQVIARAEKMGDLFAPVLDFKQRLPDLKGVCGLRGGSAAGNLDCRSGGRRTGTPVEHRAKNEKKVHARKPGRKV
jgi:bifunctional non-homologous end joining protein LigD